MVRSFVAAILFGVSILPSPVWARPALPALSVTRTSSTPKTVVTVIEEPAVFEEPWSVLVSVGPEVILEASNAVEKGIFHPEALNIFILMNSGWPWLSAFAHSRVGEGGESYAGPVVTPLSLFGVDPRALRLDLGIGVGMKAKVPIPGWILRLEVSDDVLLLMKGHHHSILGWDQDLLYQFRLSGEWQVELWGGVYARVAGEDHLYNSLEATPLLIVRLRWPIDVKISFGLPFHRSGQYQPKVRVGLEFEGHF